MKRYLSFIFSIFVMLSLFTGCGASSKNSMAQAAPEEQAVRNDQLAAEAAPQSAPLPENRKWVITSNVQAETENLEETLEAIFSKVKELEGYVEDQRTENGSAYSDYRYRSAELTIRVPAAQIDHFTEAVAEKANVVSSNKNLEDITLQYVDSETRLEALKKEEARLLELMDQAETMADLLTIEQRLTDVHYELESVTSRLRTFDNQVNFATVYIRLDEVKEYTPVEEPSFLTRITEGFSDSLEGVGKGLVNLTVILIVSIPYLAVWGVFALLVWWIVRVCRKRWLKTHPPVPEQIWKQDKEQEDFTESERSENPGKK